jgi:hypothetical protein
MKKEILEKLVRDNALHKLLAIKFKCSERRIEQWFYRALKKYNAFSKVNNYEVVLFVANYLKITESDLMISFEK